jgi:hypothetical protein
MPHAPTTPDRRRPLASLAVLAVSVGLACGGLTAPASAASSPVAAVSIAAASVSPIQQDPMDITTASGFGTAFWAYADGSVTMTSARWQVSHDGSPWTDLATGTPSFDGTQAELDTDPTTYADNGDSYRAVFTDDQDNEYPTEPAVLTVVPKVELPDSTDGHVGAPVTLTAVPEQGAPMPTGTTWQRGTEDMDNGGLTWADTTQSGATYTLGSPTPADNGVYRLHWVVGGEDFYSTYGGLYVDDRPYVSTQPTASTTVVAGTAVSWTAHLSGANGADVQWEHRASDAADWEPIDGATSETYSLAKPRLTDAGQYRATFSTADDYWTSSAATLAVTGAVPGVPSTVTATKVGVNSVKVTWDTPADAGTPATVTGYDVGWSGGDFGSGESVAGTVHEHTFTGFSAGTYTFEVKAANDAGEGEFSTGVPVTVDGVTPSSSANTTRRTAGQTFVLSGTGAPGTSLGVERALPGQGWRTLFWVDVDDAGHYAAHVPVSFSGTYRTRTSDGRVSPGRFVAATNAVSLGATRKGTRKYLLSGVVTPALKGQAVTVQLRKPNGAWSTLATVRTDAAGRWSYTKTFPKKKAYTVRAVSGDTSVGDPGSATRTIAVK